MSTHTISLDRKYPSNNCLISPCLFTAICLWNSCLHFLSSPLFWTQSNKIFVPTTPPKQLLSRSPVTPLLPSALAFLSPHCLTSRQLWTWLTIPSFLKHFLHFASEMTISFLPRPPLSPLSPSPLLAISSPTSKRWVPKCSALRPLLCLHSRSRWL